VAYRPSDTWALAPSTHLTAAVRLNRTRVRNQLDTVDDDTGAFEVQPRESFTYRSANPAIGLAHRIADALTVFSNLARNTRVPTVIELGCANPEEPCRLPVGLQADPYLEPVRSTSLELGARWRPASGQRVEISVFSTDNKDDILFSSISTTSQLGYFRNFDRTRHRGLELSWAGRQGAWQGHASLSGLDATYQADGTLRQGERNVVVRPGTRIAGLPRWGAKAGADWQPAPDWSLGADAQWVDSRGVQGNEDGRLDDGDDEPRPLRVPGHALLNLRAAWRAAPDVELLARVQNVLDRRYETHGALASTVFDAAGRFTGDEADALFVAPGAPRSFFVGLRLQH
jgi:outer membrane receptor protein involved in Fe transport